MYVLHVSGVFWLMQTHTQTHQITVFKIINGKIFIIIYIEHQGGRERVISMVIIFKKINSDNNTVSIYISYSTTV